MREAEWRAQRLADNKRVALVLRQLEFVQLRMEAMEAVIAEELKPMFKDVLWLKTKMDEKHMELLRMADAGAKAVQEAAHAEAMKPKLILSGTNGRG